MSSYFSIRFLIFLTIHLPWFPYQQGSKIKGCSPGSDIDDESDDGGLSDKRSPQGQRQTNVQIRLWVHPEATQHSRFRGNLCQLDPSNQLPLSISEHGRRTDDAPRPFLYESIMALWVRVWLESLQAKRSTPESGISHHLSSVFIDHIEFFAPLCLKSLALRFAEFRTGKTHSLNKLSQGKAKLFPSLLDDNHMKLLTSIVIIWAQSLMNRTVAKLKVDNEDESSISSSLASCDAIVDFIVGMLPMVHAAQVSLLIRTFLESLRALEAVDYRSSSSTAQAFLDDRKSAKDNNIRRIIVSRHLRLRFIDRISSLPCFVALNYPLKYPAFVAPTRYKFPTWTHQLPDNFSIILEGSSGCPYPDGLVRLPKAYWLAELLADDAFLISAASCEAILSDTMDRNEDAALSKKDIRRLQSLAVDGIAVLYESLIRRHAIDARFQGEEGRSRIAAMFVSPVFRGALDSVHWLSRMESSHKVRILWLLSFLHVLQEAPEFLIREQLRRFCDPKVCANSIFYFMYFSCCYYFLISLRQHS